MEETTGSLVRCTFGHILSQQEIILQLNLSHDLW